MLQAETTALATDRETSPSETGGEPLGSIIRVVTAPLSLRARLAPRTGTDAPVAKKRASRS